jgi:nucleoside-diphosphate-sugar epimerase
MNRVLLTGGSGKLGRYVRSALVAQDFDVLNFDKVSCRSDIDQVQADILDRESLQSAMVDRDVVIHLAALDAAVPATEQAFFEINVQGTWNVLEAAEKTGVQRVVLCSSVAALGIGDQNLPDYLPIDEKHPCRPRQAYGLSKQVAETVGQCFARRGHVKVVCLRPAFVVFPDLVIATALALSEQDGVKWPYDLPQDSDGLNEPLTATRSFIAPEDAADSFVAAARSNLSSSWQLYFAVAPWSMSQQPTLERAQTMRIPTRVVLDPSRYRATSNTSMFSSKLAEQELGWRAQLSFESLLKKALK